MRSAGLQKSDYAPHSPKWQVRWEECLISRLWEYSIRTARDKNVTNHYKETNNPKFIFLSSSTIGTEE